MPTLSSVDKARTIKYHPFVWNYGFFPQTWEDPGVVSADTGLAGDGDPLDVVEIGVFSHKRGDVVPVKVVGCLALLDEGETDWKIIAVNVNDPKANEINGLSVYLVISLFQDQKTWKYTKRE